MKIVITNKKIDFDGIFKAYLKTNPSPYGRHIDDCSADADMDEYIQMWQNWCTKNSKSIDDYFFGGRGSSDDYDDDYYEDDTYVAPKKEETKSSSVESELDEAKCIFLYQDSSHLINSNCIKFSSLAALDDYLGNTTISISAAEVKTLMNNYCSYCTIIKTDKQPFIITSKTFDTLYERANTLNAFYSTKLKKK